jgi:polyisoprenoid-binding protein YceI
MSKQKWIVDCAHSEIRFKVRHMMITNVSGCFNTFSVNMQCDEGFNNLQVQFQAETGSVNTLNPQRDQHIRNTDFFNS